MNKLKILSVLFLFTGVILTVQAQKNEFNPLIVGVPSLTIAPDARGGGMGDVGAATEPDIFSQYWNPAKYAFAYSKAGIGLTYTPWLKRLISDIDLVYLSGYYKLGEADRQAVSASLRYFSLGQIVMTDWYGATIQSVNPYEMAVDVGYSLKTSESFSLGACLRYIYSDLGSGAEDLYPGSAWAVDIAGYYNKYIMIGSSECLLGLGISASNIGTKISYDDGNTSNFLPTKLKLGASLLFPLDNYNKISLTLDANKYMIPTPPNTEGMSTEDMQKALSDYFAISPISGIFKSFTEAPGGASEKFKEIMWSAGGEYSYQDQFFVRGGYFYENPSKGNRQYFSVGAGFKLTAFQLDVAYLISTVPSNPLDQTLRFSLSFDMEGLRNLMR
ncbi:MAG: type IX secretion system outer membrane channel protein PorV [Candidatus Azobacteroides sp.]|nr:type IX secretion system outer membrane channel protein PorV [Candidatus Azobacteroides sp.]